MISWTCGSCDGKDYDHIAWFMTPADSVIPASAARRAGWVAWEPGPEEERHG